MKLFLGFSFLSGIGWMLDFACFSILTQACGIHSAVANFLSSFVGVSFVWHVALKALFKRSSDGKTLFLVLYWCYQAMSILAYSTLLNRLAGLPLLAVLDGLWRVPTELSAKILLTPCNLVTNFLFMKCLTGFMPGDPRHA